MLSKTQTQPLASCPFNKAHTFAKQKFVFHIQRCKDRQKVQHLYKTCKYNPLHFYLVQDIQMHECCCPCRQQSVQMKKRLQLTYRRSMMQPRQRSREREKGQKGQRKYEEIEFVKTDHHEQQTLQECEQCQSILKQYKERIMKSKNQKLQKFILKYYELDNQD